MKINTETFQDGSNIKQFMCNMQLDLIKWRISKMMGEWETVFYSSLRHYLLEICMSCAFQPFTNIEHDIGLSLQQNNGLLFRILVPACRSIVSSKKIQVYFENG